MINVKAQLKVVLNGKEYFFYLDNDSPPQDAKEVLFQCLKVIGQYEDNMNSQKEALKQQAEAQSKVEPIAENNDVQSGT